MSRFLSSKYALLEPYTPGEQPKTRVLTKLNTNESPFPPMPEVVAAVKKEAEILQLYPDPDSTELRKALAKRFEVDPDMIICNNGSDETLNFAFMAWCDATHPAVFPDITYGFYPVFAALNGVPYSEIPLKDDFTVDPAQYRAVGKTVFIANPNAPTGIALSLRDVETLLQTNPDNVVVVDEAYVDFGAESAVRLVDRYDNLLVVQTFSKSRSMAGARLGYGIGSAQLIADLNTVKYSTNPYNINRMTAAAGLASLQHEDVTRRNCRTVTENRAYTTAALKEMGFVCTDSKANFIFAKSDRIGGKALYTELKKRGVLIRHFEKPRIADYNRITVGSREQMDVFLDTVRQILEETV